MKKILITGASGFFGKSLLDALQGSRDDFKCYYVYSSKEIKTYDQRFQWVPRNLLNKDASSQLINELQPTHLVHLAWHVPPQQFWTAKENIDWVYASLNLFQAFCENGGKVFVGAGTLAEYDWSSGILDESLTPLYPNTLYGQCKKSLHDILVSLAKTHYPKVSIIWPRIGHFFGPQEPQAKLISKLIYSIQNNLPMNLASEEFRRPYAHVKYFGEIITKILMLNSVKELTFNMSASTTYSLGEIVECIKKTLGKDSDNIRYNAYSAPNTGPLTLEVHTKVLEEAINFKIPDTFFEDLKDLVNHAHSN